MRVTYFGIILNALGRTKFIFISSLISLGLNVVLNVIGYMLFGFIGPAIATFLAIAITAYIQLKYTARIIKVKFCHILSWKYLAGISLLNIMLGIIVYQVKYLSTIDQIMGSVLETLILGCIWGLVYLFLTWKSIRKMWFGLNRTE